MLLRTDSAVVGVESKLTETLRVHRPVVWRAPYHDPRMKTLLPGGWSDVFAASLDGSWQPKYLGVEQLVKHALAVRSRFADEELRLVYVWWEPTNADELPEVTGHRSELDELRDRLGDSSPRLHALTYSDLFAEWAASGPGAFPDHLDQLAERYAISV